jgi:hypothetical protein
MMMEVVHTSEMSVYFKTAWYYIPERCHLGTIRLTKDLLVANFGNWFTGDINFTAIQYYTCSLSHACITAL